MSNNCSLDLQSQATTKIGSCEMTKNENREEELEETPMQYPNKKGWPNGVREIGIDEMSNFGIDGQSQIYWNGKLIEIKKRISLSPWQKFGAVVVAVAAFSASMVGVWEWGCDLTWIGSG